MSESAEELGTVEDARVVTALRATNSGEKIRVYVDGSHVASVDALRLDELDLRVGRALSDRDLDKIEAAGQLSRAREMALRWLAVRPRSRVEIERRLIARKIDRDAARRVVARLGESGLLDDEAFALARIAALRAKGAGPRLVEHKLRESGVERELIERLIRREFDGADLVREAMALAEARLAPWRGELEPRTMARRLGAFLARRGYAPETCVRAVEGAMRHAGETMDDDPPHYPQDPETYS